MAALSVDQGGSGRPSVTDVVEKVCINTLVGLGCDRSLITFILNGIPSFKIGKQNGSDVFTLSINPALKQQADAILTSYGMQQSAVNQDVIYVSGLAKKFVPSWFSSATGKDLGDWVRMESASLPETVAKKLNDNYDKFMMLDDSQAKVTGHWDHWSESNDFSTNMFGYARECKTHQSWGLLHMQMNSRGFVDVLFVYHEAWTRMSSNSLNWFKKFEPPHNFVGPMDTVVHSAMVEKIRLKLPDVVIVTELKNSHD